MRVQPDPPLVFFFSGAELPNYARVSLAHHARNWSSEVWLVSDRHRENIHPFVRQSVFDEWFDDVDYLQFCSQSELEREFMGEFWFRTAERFFVLPQFAKRHGLQSLLHAELDVVVFRDSELFRRLDNFGSGVFFPVPTEPIASGAWVYVNDIQHFEGMPSLMLKRVLLGTEMNILYDLVQNESRFFGLPDFTWLAAQARFGGTREPAGLNGSSLTSRVPLDVTNGVFDFARVGQWLLGLDKVHQRGGWVLNHFLPNPEQPPGLGSLLRSSRFLLSRKAGLSVSIEGQTHKIYNLHVHSKAMRRATHPAALRLVLAVGQLPFATPIRISWCLIGRKTRSFSLRMLDRSYLRLIPRKLRRSRR